MSRPASKEDLIKVVRDYYVLRGKPLPASAMDYIEDFPKGLSRQVVKKWYDLTVSELLELINPEYEIPSKVDRARVVEVANNLKYEVLDISGVGNAKKIKVKLKCKDCKTEHQTTYESLRGSKLGCRYCKSKNISYRDAPIRLLPHLNRLNVELVSEIPQNQQGLVSLKHKPCGHTYEVFLVHVVHESFEPEASCPVCNTFEDIPEKSSEFEKECYELLKEYSSNIKLQVPYSSIIPTNRKWTVDFLIDDTTFIEVSSYPTAQYPGYYSRLSEKRIAVDKYPNLDFRFFNTIADLKFYLITRYSLASSES